MEKSMIDLFQSSLNFGCVVADFQVLCVHICAFLGKGSLLSVAFHKEKMLNQT